MKSFRLFREVSGPAEGLYRALVGVLNEAGRSAEPPLFVQLPAEGDCGAEALAVDVRAHIVAGIVHLRLRAHASGGNFPLFQGTLELIESRSRGSCVRMRGTYLVPHAQGRAQRSIEARRRAETALHVFLESIIEAAARQSVA